MNRIFGFFTTSLGVAILATSSTRCALAAPKKTAPNAYDIYLRAGKNLNRDFKGFDFPPFGNNTKNANSPASWRIREGVLRRNAHTLKLVRQGFAFPYTPPRLSKAADYGDNFTLFAQMREVARLMSVEAEVYAHRGEYSKSIGSALDAIRLGKDLSRGMTIDSLVGNAVSSIGQSQIKRATIDKLSASEAKNAARRLESLEARDVSYADTLREEKRFGNISLREMFKGGEKEWRQEYPTTKTPRQITVDFNRLMDEAIINASLPFHRRKTQLSQPDDAVNEEMVGYYTSGPAAIGIFQARDNTISQILKTMLALRAFRVERGAFPDTLDQLTPNYLRRAPLDLFSGKTLRYVKKNDAYLLYSIGYDRADDGGKPLPKRAFYDAKGDIVAGVNTK